MPPARSRIRERSVLEPYRHAAFDAHWRRHKNLEADADLRELASSVGLDPGEALAAADDPAYLERVDENQADARAQGVSGIPTFFFGTVRVVGCQPYEALARAAETAGAITLFTASALGVPVSTTHTITGAIVGVGSVRRLSAVRWGVAGRIVWAWILTIPAAAIIAALTYQALTLFGIR